MNKEFEGKYAVVTGGAGGISYEAAKTLAKKGLSGVVLADAFSCRLFGVYL